jgi:hypothetical protein
MNSLKGLIKILQEIENQCLGDEIKNDFIIKIYDDRRGQYMILVCNEFGFNYEWVD